VAGDGLRAAASQAGLTPAEQKEIDALNKLMGMQKELTSLPAAQSQQKFNKLPNGQKEALVKVFGDVDDKPEEEKNWFESVKKYYNPVLGFTPAIAKGLFKGLDEVSDFMTRAQRTVTLAFQEVLPGKEQGKRGIKTIGEAFDLAGADGRELFNISRIEKAKKKYGENYMSVAMKVAQGQSLAQITVEGTDEEKAIAANAVQEKDSLYEDALDAAKAAQYSLGRSVANILPESMEGSGFLYTGISGTVDAAYRVFADPTLLLGKAKKVYDVANYSLIKIIGDPKKLDQAFNKKPVIDFFNEYGSELQALSTARKAKDITKATEIQTRIKRLVPEFGPVVSDEFIKAGVKDAATAKNYFQNIVDVNNILKGQPARITPLIPRLDAARQARIGFLTTANKVFNIDKVGRKIVSALYGAAPSYDEIATGIINQPELIAAAEKKVGKLKGPDGAKRFTIDQIQERIDKFSAKFTTIPYFKDGYFDVMGADAPKQIFQLSRLTNSRYHSKIIAEAFDAGSEGQRKQIYKGLIGTIYEVRGVTKSATGLQNFNEFLGKGLNKQYAPDIVVNKQNLGNPADFNGQQVALFPYQLSTGIATPKIQDLDRLASRSGLIDRLLGLSHQKWASTLTSGWVIATLAGPRFAIRNATEDILMHLAIGRNPWGVVKGRLFSTRVRVGMGITGDKTLKETAKDTALLKVKAGELGAVNKFLKRSELKEFKTKIDNADSEEAVRKILGEAVLRRSVAQTLDPRGSAIIDEVARFGNLPDTLRAVSEGSKNALSGADQYLRAIDDVARFGPMAPITINGAEYVRVTGEKAFTQFNPVASMQARVSWLVQIGIHANDDLGKIAVTYLDEPKKAVDEMRKYLDNLTDTQRNRFELYSLNGDTQIHAEKAYAAIRNTFSKADGKINEDLLSKVRFKDAKGKVTVKSDELSIDDLPDNTRPDLVPEYISGPTLVPVSEQNFQVSGFIERTWDGMGEANARFSREGIVLNEIITVRKMMQDSGFDKTIRDRITAGLTGDALAEADDFASRHIISVAEEMAKERVLAFVDNPAVRSQLAMSVRNFARFYRATEDFYRRVYRAVRYNPDALVRGSLVYEGIAHNGFIKKDDNGEAYFMYPGLTPVYQTMLGVTQAFGVEEAFKTPMPIDFGAKINMLTPSLNPDAMFPTFSGPLSSVPLKFLFDLVPQFDALDRIAFGTYGEDQTMMNALFPGHINRIIATLDRDERRSQFASATRKAATYLEAAGYGVKPTFNEQTQTWDRPTDGELKEYQDRIQATALTVLGLRFFFYFVAPASPQPTLKSDMQDWAKASGSVNFKQVWNDIRTRYNGDIEKATAEWVKYYPDQMPFTVNESESTVVAVASAVDGTIDWLKSNQSLLKKYPNGAPFLMPNTGKFDFNAYKLLYKSGIKESKPIDDFIREVQVAKDSEFYYSQKDDYENRLQSIYSDFGKRDLRKKWDAWSKQYMNMRPLLKEEMTEGSKVKAKRDRAYQDLSLMLDDPTVTVEPKSLKALRTMKSVYDQYVLQKDSIRGNSDFELNAKERLKFQAKEQLKKIAASNENANSAYTVLFSKLIGE
jgi:hypothetical protein